ncbi:MAG: hypothetical protein ACI9WS_002115 [Paraglaciecola psychrophila]
MLNLVCCIVAAFILAISAVLVAPPALDITSQSIDWFFFDWLVERFDDGSFANMAWPPVDEDALN